MNDERRAGDGGGDNGDAGAIFSKEKHFDGDGDNKEKSAVTRVVLSD